MDKPLMERYLITVHYKDIDIYKVDKMMFETMGLKEVSTGFNIETGFFSQWKISNEIHINPLLLLKTLLQVSMEEQRNYEKSVPIKDNLYVFNPKKKGTK